MAVSAWLERARQAAIDVIFDRAPNCRRTILPAPPLAEMLERRLILSASVASVPIATPPIALVGPGSPATNQPGVNTPGVTTPFTPSDIVKAYGVNAISFGATAGSGAGQTIAIVDAYNDPNIVSDASTFNSRFGLPQFNTTGNPTFQVLNENGHASPLPANVSGSTGNWDSEEALDVEWAHAIAPQANIILFEANTAGTDLYTAVTTAAGFSGVSGVSMSWGSPEFSFEANYDTKFVTPAGHSGVTFIASAGDTDQPADYPAYSPNVLAVGGTTLTLGAGGAYGSESAWGDMNTGVGGGGGVSEYETQPAYQNGKVNGFGGTPPASRTAPDVAMLADTNTGVYMYNTWNQGANNGGYFVAGGTSLACPMWAGLMAIANQGRSLAGLSALDGPSQTLPRLYGLPSSDFHDVTTGSNGFSANAGYDLDTGIGTPIANLLVPQLAGVSSSASKLAFSVGPTNSLAGTALNPVVTVKVLDAFGDVVTSDASRITLSFGANPATGTLGGTTTVAAVNGMAQFADLSIDQVGAGYSLSATDGSLTGVTSNTFTISPAAPAQLVFVRQPGNMTVGIPAAAVLAVNIQDAFGNLETGDNSTVSLMLNGGMFDDGSNSINLSAVGGVADFGSLAIDSANTYTLTARGDGLTAQSSSFTVSRATPTMSVTDGGKTYDGLPCPATNASASDAYSGIAIAQFGDDALTYEYFSGTLSSAQAAIATPLGAIPGTAGAYTVVAHFSGSADYTSADSSPVSFSITRRTLHVTAAAQSKVYDSTPQASVTLDDDRVSGDALILSYATALFADKDAAVAKGVNVGGISIGGLAAGNYVLAATAARAVANITPASVTGAIDAASKVYDGTTSATLASTSLAGIFRGDLVTLGGGRSMFDSQDVASARNVSCVGLILAGPQAGDYILANPVETSPGSILPLAISGSITAANKVYDGTATASISGRLLIGVLGNDDVSLVGGNAAFNSAQAPIASSVTATNLTLAGAQAADYMLANPTETTPASIVPLQVVGSITAANKTYDGSIAANIASRALSGILDRDAVTLTGGFGAFDSSAVGDGKTVTVSGLALGGPQAGDYALVNPMETALASVSPLAISGTVFNDANGDGIQQAGESGLAGRTVYLQVAGKGSKGQRIARTDAGGNFSFSQLPVGGYVLRVLTPAGWRSTTPGAAGDSLSISVGRAIGGLSFGQTNGSNIGGTVYLDANRDGKHQPGEQGLADWTVMLSGAGARAGLQFTATTDSAGTYFFSDVPAGSYHLTATQPEGDAVSIKAARPRSIAITLSKSLGGQDMAEQILAAAARSARSIHRK